MYIDYMHRKMERAYAVSLCLCAVTFAVTFPIVRCRQINYHRGNDGVRSAERYVAEEESCTTDAQINEEERMITAYPPHGVGLFRDPTDVLGPKFKPSETINLCEVQLQQHANEISEIEFTGRGNKTCQDVCIQYRANMRLNGPVTVVLLEYFCDYTGVTIGFVKDCDTDLTTTCTCMYNMRCNQRSRAVMYIFESNCQGFLKVSVTELKKNIYIT